MKELTGAIPVVGMSSRRRIIERGIAIDDEEDKLYGDKKGDELPPELNTQEKLREKIKEIEYTYYVKCC